MNILIYKLRKNYRMFGFSYCGIAKFLEISLWFFNIVVMWGNEEKLNAKYR